MVFRLVFVFVQVVLELEVGGVLVGRGQAGARLPVRRSELVTAAPCGRSA